MWYLYMLFLEREIRKNLSERLVRLLIIIWLEVLISMLFSVIVYILQFFKWKFMKEDNE
jgi:phage shock protein PspC (stress-responsive transcriptional regulator)